MIERKCRRCNTWNKEEDYCISCGNAISPAALDKLAEENRRAKEALISPSKFSVFMTKAKNHRFWPVRLFYKLLYSIGVMISLFAALLAWMAAIVNA